MIFDSAYSLENHIVVAIFGELLCGHVLKRWMRELMRLSGVFSNRYKNNDLGLRVEDRPSICWEK